VKLVHRIGFIIKKFVTMHGHVNVKKKKIVYVRDLLEVDNGCTREHIRRSQGNVLQIT